MMNNMNQDTDTDADPPMESSEMPPEVQSRAVSPHAIRLIRKTEKPKVMFRSVLPKMDPSVTKTVASTVQKSRSSLFSEYLYLRDGSQDESSTDPKRTWIEHYPSEMVFLDYIPGEVHELLLFLRNTGENPQVVKVLMEGSPYFELAGLNNVYHLVPARRFITVKVIFRSERSEHYSHRLLLTTDKEEITVPIRAIGARPILDFPEQVDFSSCPVNAITQRTLPIHNSGNFEARYHISTMSPFSVSPATGILKAGETMQVTVQFNPREVKRYSKSLVVKCYSVDDVQTTLFGKAVNVSIGLEKGSVKFEKTYITLSSQGTVVIHNRTPYSALFKWKAFATEEEEYRQKMRLCHGLSRPVEEKAEDVLKKRYGRLSLFSHIFNIETARVQADPLMFSDDSFTIEPLVGEVPPNGSTEVKVLFTPQEVQVYEKMAYCEISGREDRLALRLTGEGLGPSLQFNVKVLDIGKVFAGADHSYEIILLNKGAIDAPFKLIPPTTEQGSCFTFEPQEGTIAPNGAQPIQISFNSTILKQFKEEFQFNVIGSLKPVTLTIRGRVTGVSLNFNISGLHFGDVSFGFPQTLPCRMTNTSVVPITFHLHIPEDGSGEPSISSFDQVKDNSHPCWVKATLPQSHVKPVEFTITPCTGTIPAEGSQDIKVTLCSNNVGQYNYQMVLDVDDVGKEVLLVPITARCIVPQLYLLNAALNFGKCALKVPYEDTLTLVNNSHLPGCYAVLPQKQEKATSLQYSSPKPCGIIEPYSTTEIPITIKAQALGRHCIMGDIAVFGREGMPLNMRLMCSGEPPAVYTSLSKIDFGNIQVLQDASQTLQLCNQGIVPAAFRAEMGAKWCNIEPREGVIPPRSEVSVIVTANLDDAAKFEDQVQLFIENQLLQNMSILAVGVGTTIVIDKPFAPELKLGPQYSLVPCIFRFKVTNKGRQFHRLYWSTEGFSSFRQRRPLPALTVTKGKDASQRPKSATPTFKLQPLSMDLMPGQGMELVVQGFSSTLQEVKEKVVCHAAVGEAITKQKIIQTTVSATFISPAVQLSPREISFRVEKYPSDVLTLQYKPLSFKNTCSLPFSLILDVEQPFLICDADQQPLPADAQPLKVEVGEELHLCIRFDPAYEKGLTSWETEKTMRIRFVEHPHKEQMTIRGAVYYPNLHLQTKTLDFGCILTDTEQVRCLKVTNCGPIPASYRWSFQVDRQEYPTRLILFQPMFKPHPPPGRISYFERVAYSRRHFRSASVTKPTSVTEEVQNSDQQSSWSEDSLGSEVFDVVPVSGVLQPGETQQVPFTFFGRSSIVARVTALCSVEGGPTYQVQLTGEASGVTYHLNVREIDCGLQLFSEVTQAEVTLQNTGKIGFTYTVLSPSTDTADNPLPGVLMVTPDTGYIEPDKEQVLKLDYLPGLPGVFCRTFQLQVGHLKPEEISMKGEAVFPRIAVDLPWNIKGNKKYKKILKKAQEKLENENQKNAMGKAFTMEPPMDDSDIVLDTWLKMEMEQILIKENALKLQGVLTSCPPKDTIFDKQIPQKLMKVELPEYFLDMGTVVLGCTATHIVRITNTGKFPVSFRANDRVLHDTGFSADIEPVQFLTYCSTRTFQVRFESANQPVGEVDVVLPIKVARGPTIHIHLHATVVQLALTVSRDRVQFSEVQVGQCQVETVWLYNRFKVPCHWSVTVNKPAKKVDKHSTPATCQKELQPCAFFTEVGEGTVPGKGWYDLRIRFSPTEEKSYKNDLKISLRGSSECLLLPVSGHGLEPRLEFSPPELKLGPMLPCSPGVEVTVVVKNPCKFPIEFYSLEFDEEYLEEEKILRQLRDFRYHRVVLMPPRAVGEKLPPEVLEDYEKRKEAQNQQIMSKLKQESDQNDGVQKSVSFKKDLVEMCESPVYRSVKRYLGIDTSLETCKALKFRGIVVIVCGTPQTGKSTAAVALSKYYSAACLSLDTIVIEAMSSRGSSAGHHARELCAQAAHKQKSKETQKTGKKGRAGTPAKKNKLGSEKVSQKAHSAGQQSASRGKKTASDKSHRKFSLTSKTSAAPEPQWLTITTSKGEKVDCLTCVLPEETLVEIISERLKLSDCYKGVVFDGLESLFSSNPVSSLLCVLKAISNRPYIHVVNIFQEYGIWKARQIAEKEREIAEKEQKEREEEEAARREEERLWNVDEDEYDALPQDQKILLNNRIRQVQRERKQRELERLAQEHQEGKEQPHPGKVKQPAEPQQQKSARSEEPTEREKILDLRFRICESSQKKIKHILTFWDRVQSVVHLPLNQEEDKMPAKHKGHKKMSPEKSEKPQEKHRSLESSKTSQPEEEGSVEGQDAGVPCLDIQVTGPEDVFRMIMESNKLPSAEQILDFLGVGPSGPPICPGAIFSMVSYPMKRTAPTEDDLKHFILLEPEDAAEEDIVAPDAESSSSKSHSKKKKGSGRGISIKEKRNSIQSIKSLPDSCTETSTSSPERRRSQDHSVSTIEKPARLKRYRWIVPAHGEVEMKIHFSTTVTGQFEQMMNFELLGSKRLYQLPCSATSLYPTINQNPWTVFPHCRKSKEEDDIIHKEFVMSTKQFHFGPLLCGMSRAWYKADGCPGNCEKITIHNTSPVEAEVHFSFEDDDRAKTFLLDPPSMMLKPKEKQKLTLWACPASAGLLEDRLICCIKDNPEPVVFQLCCEGVDVKLGVSPSELCFGKLLLHTSSSQTLVLKNPSPLPMAWHLNGVDDLGEEFSVSQYRGIVSPRSDFELNLDFVAKKIGVSNKMVRVEVSDAEDILGICYAEIVKISVEVYDVNLSISLPKGQGTTLDFGIINVQDRKKEVMSLKNRGTYDIEYCFKLKTGGSKMHNLESQFTIQPTKGMLKASRPPVNVEVLFHPTTELFLKSKPILLCQVIDPSLDEASKTVATIPLCVSAKAAFSKYSIEPASPIDFGAMIKGTKKSQVLTLENKGMLSFKFCIRQAPQRKGSQEKESAPAVKERKSSTQGSLTLGMFTMSPSSGSVGPWGQQKITVDCNAGPEGKCEEQLCIDISGRDPKDNPLGIPFTLIAESCFPTLVEDITSVFEQYPIYSSSRLRRRLQSVEGNGVFVKDENKFIFNKVLVGQQATAYFKISNGSCLPSDVVLSINAVPETSSSQISKIFKLDPVKMSIDGLSHAFAKVTFSPQDDQPQQCIFRASLVIPKSSPVKVKPQQLTFTLSGQGNKPQVTVVYPELQSKSGNPVLRFRRLLLGDSQKLPLLLQNNGMIPAQFTLHVVDEHGVFLLKGKKSALDNFHIADMEGNSSGKAKKPCKKPYLLLQYGQSAEFDVFFKPTLAQRLEGKICVTVAGNCEDMYIELVGEGYDDDFTLDNLPGQGKDSEMVDAGDEVDRDIIEAVRGNHIEFGDCAVRRHYHQTFTVTNHSKVEVMRFEWLADAPFQFSPKVGHLQPGCTKDIRVTLKSDVPVTLQRERVTCTVTKIKYELPPEQVYDWDDRMCTDEWVDGARKGPAARWPVKEKVTKTVLEPPHTLLENSSQEVELFLSAVVDYAKFKLNTTVVQFKQTKVFQATMGIFKMYNTGNVALSYSWELDMDQKRTSRRFRKPFSSTLMSYFLSSAAVKLWFKHHARQLSQSRQRRSSQGRWKRLRHVSQYSQSIGTSMDLSPSDIEDAPPFSIEPRSGTVPAGRSQMFQVIFSPTSVGNFKGQLQCRLSNLKPYKKPPSVTVIGRGWMQQADLEPSGLSSKDGAQSSKPQKSLHWAPTLE